MRNEEYDTAIDTALERIEQVFQNGFCLLSREDAEKARESIDFIKEESEKLKHCPK